MLQGINRIGKSWVGRVLVAVLFALLIVSFAIWGIGDVFRGNVRTQVATVGGVDITGEAYRNAYQTEYQALIRRSGRSVTPDQARALGLEERVLARLVSEAAFDHETRRHGITVSDELVIKAIQEDPTFRGPSGAFDRNQFSDLLRQNGMSEQQYVREQRLVMARQQLAEALSGALRIPLSMREAVHRYQSERRTAEIIRLGAAQAGELPAPADDKLQAFYEERKASFRAPEYRIGAIMTLTPATIAKPDAVTDAEAREYYAKVKDSRFGSQERRAIQQILFPTKEAAAEAVAKIKAGTSFEAIAKELGIDDATLDLGTLTRGEVLDEATAKAAFELPEGGISDPIEGRFGTAVVRVAKIEPAAMKPFEEVVGEVKKDIALERARDELQALHDTIEDQRAGAKPMAEIARDKKLPLVEIPAFDRNGRGKDGQPVAALAGQPALLQGLFRTEPGSDNEAVNTLDGGYIWYEVTKIEPARDRPLDEIRDQVVAEWRKAEIARLLSEKATALVERIDKGETVEAVAESLGLKWQTVTDLARGQAKDDLPAPVVTRIFATPVGKAGSAAPDDENRVLFKVTGASVPPFVTTTQEAAGAERQLRTLMTDDILAEYLSDVERRIGVQVYRQNIRRAIGGEG
ncbi:SurA N-terminal domain-containing protein [Enterovirga rhinocerotis]|uniref:Parvulin-like PPIase n=1 Tax=Enterovirga rhinocerotis TaxID=1339210 RepID=A0A4R7C7Q5_9HYPH|nr:SurA N-terminal domain-containing protein [Enterovirga rhinocerotis]TDR93992.1 peptidyl-prolyl cis-trans isomerase D [Enterovirga rhinocerotis]